MRLSHRRALWLLVGPLSAIASTSACAQDITRSTQPTWVGSMSDGYQRLLQLTGAAPLASRMLRPTSQEERDTGCSTPVVSWTDPWHRHQIRCDTARPPRVLVYSPETRVVYNSAVPYGVNDGSLWAGRGMSASLDGGVALHVSGVLVRFAPSITASQNLAFPMGALVKPPSNASPYADPLISRVIDRPQRFGNGGFGTVDGGQSVARLDARSLSLGVGTENMWWGPGIDNALLMTNNAPGFPHAFLGTSRPLNVFLGHIEALYLVGRLYDSQYWRIGNQPDRNRRWLTTGLVVFEPGPTPGLYLGGGRTLYAYIPKGGLRFGDFFTIAQPFLKDKLASGTSGGTDQSDQMLSFFARWVFPEVGFEVYGEWGRNDHSWNTRDLILEPDHADATLLGFQKVLKSGSGFVLLRAEATSLAKGRSNEVRPEPTWYAHTIVTQGFTQVGQVIGAGIGPGSDTQAAALERYFSRGSFGFIAERTRDNSDAFYDLYADTTAKKTEGNYFRHDVTTALGVRASLMLNRVWMSLTLERRMEYDRYTIAYNDVRNVSGILRSEWRW